MSERNADRSPGVVRSERRGAVAVLTIEHPPANAVDVAIVEGLRAELRALAGSPDVGALVLTGHGERFFSAGADVTEFAHAGAARILSGQVLTTEIEAFPKVTVAAINGVALGGGLEIAMACDIRLAAEHARLGQPEIDLGIIPGWGGTQRLPRLIGRGRATYLLLTGEPIDAATALQWGLVSRVVDRAALLDAAVELAERCAAKPPRAVAAIKQALARGVDHSLEGGLDVERAAFAGVFDSEDAREGIAAFLEKRSPTFRGR